jgi:hypothetical protein
MIFEPNVSISRASLCRGLPSLNQIFYLTFNSNIGDFNLLMVKDFVVLISMISINDIEIIDYFKSQEWIKVFFQNCSV